MVRVANIIPFLSKCLLQWAGLQIEIRRNVERNFVYTGSSIFSKFS